MKPYRSVSLLPEALVASHLEPTACGSYLATGTKKRSRGQAVFFRLNGDYANQRMQERDVDANLEWGDTALPRHFVYRSIYRVLYQCPLGNRL
jgi:hypothetical protein